MFDIKAKIQKDLKYFESILNEMKDGKIEDYFFIVRFKNPDRPCEFSYEIDESDFLMWVGIFEHIKHSLLLQDQKEE